MTNSLNLRAMIFTVFALSLVNSEVTHSQSCGKSYSTPAGQLKTSENGITGEYPWYASLYKKQDHTGVYTQVCGGTVISPRVILTAGHCTYGGGARTTKADDLKVAVRKNEVKWDVDNKETQKFDVERIVPHPSFKSVNSEFSNDLALVILAQDMKMSDTSLPACVDWAGSQLIHNGEIGTIVSWNRTSDNIKDNEIHLRTVKGSYLDASTCTIKAPDQLKRYITPEKFCINYTNGLGLGDSGAGLTVEKNGRHYVVGVGGLGSAKISPIFVFINIASYKDWIQSIVKQVHPPSPPS